MQRERIDKVLVDHGLAPSRTKAQALVMAGVVLANEQLVNKPSETFAIDSNIRLKSAGDPAARYVGRGGLQLEAALREFQIDVTGLICLDVGASTGGFTDCLLQHGAKRVVAIDVGHNQIDWRLRNDPRIEVREGVNARYLKPADFEQRFDLARREEGRCDRRRSQSDRLATAKRSAHRGTRRRECTVFEAGRFRTAI